MEQVNMPRITLQLKKPAKPNPRGAKGNIIIMYTRPQLDDRGKQIVIKGKKKDDEDQIVMEKITKKMNFGDTFDEEAQTAFEILAKYKGLLAPVTLPTAKAVDAAPANKMLKDEARK